MPHVFCRIAVGYVIAYASFIPWIMRQRRQLRENPRSLQPESRLWWLLFSPSLIHSLASLIGV